MLQLLAIATGLIVGFVGARLLRRPSGTARAASVARSVGGAVGTRRDLDLARLQRSVFSEMMRHVVSRGAATSVPAAYVVHLHPDDHATVAQAPGFFTQGLVEAMTAAGREHGWTVPPRLQVELSIDPSRRRGVPAVEANAPPPADAAPPRPSSPTHPARLERRGDPNATHELVGTSATIGRGTDRTIRIEDSRVSRRHAALRHDGASWTLVDEGSSNGTRLGGKLIEVGTPQLLHDGDEIEVGPAVFVFRARGPVAPKPEDRTRADERPYALRVLDEQQRRSISQDFFPDDDVRSPWP